MTNLLAAIFVTVGTNWTTSGTFVSISGVSEEVQVGRLETNFLAVIEWREQKRELVLETCLGPICGERRVPIKQQSFVIPATVWQTNIYWTNSLYLSQ